MANSPVPRRWLSSGVAAISLGALLLLLIITWPLAAQLGRSLPGDYGDPLFVTWVMGWVNGRLLEGGFSGFWDANIFYPEEDTLAFSESFIAQSVMVLPVYWLTGNLILSYNVAFALAFVLTAAGAFLLTRALAGSVPGAMLAGIVAAFNEYRLAFSLAHLHTLSLHWWLFAMYFLHRYLVTDRRRYLAGLAASLIALHLSSVYYTAYGAPLLLAFAIAEMVRLGRWRTARVWLELWAAGAIALVGMLPFVLPYMAVQQRLGVERSLAEVVQGAATLDHYLAAFPGMAAPLLLAVVGATGVFVLRPRRAVAAVLLLLLALAFWFSLGPEIRWRGETLAVPAPYSVLYEYAPGYRSLRVPARFVSFVFVLLGGAAAIGVAVIESRWPRGARWIAAGVVLVFLRNSVPTPIPLNVALPSPDLVNPPPAYLTPGETQPGIYRAVDSLRPGAIVVELPFGDMWYDLRYMYFSATHRRRMLNGYSGIFPPSYLARQQVLKNPLLDLEASARALSAATHVVVHRRAWRDDTGARVAAWLESYGAVVIAEADGAMLYELPIREELARSSLRRLRGSEASLARSRRPLPT